MTGHFGTVAFLLAHLPQLSTALFQSTVSSHSASSLPVVSEEKQLAGKLEKLKQDEMDAKAARHKAELAVEQSWVAEAKYQQDIGRPPPPESEKHLYIERTAVTMPDNWITDYTWGHSELYLYPEGLAPGHRIHTAGLTPEMPAFDENMTEHWNMLFASDNQGGDWLTEQGCVPPGGLAGGHLMMFSKNATLVPFVLDKEKHPARTDAAVVIVPGGGGELLTWDDEGISVATWLNGLGINAFVLNYRTPVDLSAPVLSTVDQMDLQRAISLIRHNAREYGINPSRIGAAGFSHGAAVILNGIYDPQLSHRAYARIDDVDDVDYTLNFLILAYPETYYSTHSPSYSYASDQLHRLPPTFWATSHADKCTGPANAPYIKAMQNNPASQVTMRVYEQGGHGWASCELEPVFRGNDVCEWKSHAAEFLNKSVFGHV